jgi:hypothetical protein
MTVHRPSRRLAALAAAALAALGTVTALTITPTASAAPTLISQGNQPGHQRFGGNGQPGEPGQLPGQLPVTVLKEKS